MSISLLKQIWANPNCILIVFVGSSAEFAVNPAVEWLFYTGWLPSDPIGRFISTLDYTQRLIFAPTEAAHIKMARQIRRFHTALEEKRGRRIPDAAYRDVLFMNLEYSIRAYPLVFGRELGEAEKDEIVREFAMSGHYMQIPDLPTDYPTYLQLRQERFKIFEYTPWTDKLLAVYQQVLGPIGYYLLNSGYGGLLHPQILEKLRLRPNVSSWLFRKFCAAGCKIGVNKLFFTLFLPLRVRQVVRTWDAFGTGEETGREAGRRGR